MSQSTVDILLATYNGAKYLEEQLNSISRQTDINWRLVIRDDGSTDESPEIIEKFRAADPERVCVISDGRKNLGPAGNFAALLAASSAPYGMFCDQDDVWLPEKIAESRMAMAALEVTSGSNRPLFIHSDLIIVDENLQEIAPSYLKFRQIDPTKGRALPRLLMQNIAPGCSVMFNAKLRELALPFPPEALMHDWWMVLIAASLGAVGSIEKALVLYRQHDANSAGAGASIFREGVAWFTTMPAAFRPQSQNMFYKTQRQAAALAHAYVDGMGSRERQLICRYAELSQRNYFARRLDILRYGYRRNGPFFRNVSLMLFA